MADLTVNRLTNANIYVGGSSWLGKAEEIMLPDISHKMAEHKGLGMVGTIELPSGIDKMEMSIKWNSFYPEVLTASSSSSDLADIQVRANLETYTNGGLTGEKSVVVYLKGAFKNIPVGTFKQHDNVELTSKLTVCYVKMEIDGASLYEVDVMNNIYIVGGVDKLDNYRKNLGI